MIGLPSYSAQLFSKIFLHRCQISLPGWWDWERIVLKSRSPTNTSQDLRHILPASGLFNSEPTPGRFRSVLVQTPPSVVVSHITSSLFLQLKLLFSPGPFLNLWLHKATKKFWDRLNRKGAFLLRNGWIQSAPQVFQKRFSLDGFKTVFFVPSGNLFIGIDLDFHQVCRFHDYLTLPLFSNLKFRIAEFQ